MLHGILSQSEWPPFLDWMPEGFNTWEAWVAIGTFTLALATFWLSRQTRKDVDAATKSADAARRSAEISERAFAASVRPMLAQSTLRVPRVERSGSVVTAHVAFRNVGSGLGLIQGMGWQDLPPGVTMVASTANAAVRDDEDTWIAYELNCDDAAHAEAIERQLHEAEGGFTVHARYVDATGNQPTRTQATLVYGASTGWGFKEVAVFEVLAERAFAVLTGRSVEAKLGQAVEHDHALPITPRGGAPRS